MKHRALVCPYLLVGVLAVQLSVSPAQAQILTIGTVSIPVQVGCSSDFLSNSTCYNVVVSCPSAEPLGATYGSAPQNGSLNGTIIMFSGLGGTTLSTDTGQEAMFASYYQGRGYQIVQFKWDSDWEDTNNGLTGHVPYAWNIQAAACRPATFLQYVFANVATDQSKGFCAQGASGGSGAIAYSMAWYGAGSGQTGYTPLDKVELAVGPPL
jgi:hypothetical protein